MSTTRPSMSRPWSTDAACARRCRCRRCAAAGPGGGAARFDDVLVLAGRDPAHPSGRGARALGPRGDAAPHRRLSEPASTASSTSSRSTTASRTAQAIMHPVIGMDIRADIGGDQQAIQHMQVEHGGTDLQVRAAAGLGRRVPLRRSALPLRRQRPHRRGPWRAAMVGLEGRWCGGGSASSCSCLLALLFSQAEGMRTAETGCALLVGGASTGGAGDQAGRYRDE